GGSDRESPLLIERRTAADDAGANELRGKIQSAVDALEEKYRVVFLLRDVEGLSIQETAEALEISVPAVKSRLHRARLFLRASLERYVSE
ncbi:MAG: RNA polymerase sigma-70 factor (ECF subfamily), partial [Bradymonadia bacterium]